MFRCSLTSRVRSLNRAMRRPRYAIESWFFGASAFPPGLIVPVCVYGFGRCNVPASTAAGDGIGGTAGSTAGTRFANAGTGFASSNGLVIAVALEAVAQADTSIANVYGVAGHSSVRAIIGKL